ncbi:hypothetical protein ACKWTF_015946 [Chironomus riparius]
MSNTLSLSAIIHQISTRTYDYTIEDGTINAIFQSNEEINSQFNDRSFKHYFANQKCILTFCSDVGDKVGKIFWKTANQDEFNLLEVSCNEDMIVLELCRDFIYGELRSDRTGILTHSKDKKHFNIRDIGTVDGKNLLILELLKCNHDNVTKLCQYNFDVDCEFELLSKDGQLMTTNPIEKAWDDFINSDNANIKESSNLMILSLLNANSTFPVDFDYTNASDEVKNFVDECEEVHRLVESRDLPAVQEKVESLQHLCHIYNEYNESLLIYALRLKSLDIVEILESAGLSIGSHEVDDLQEIYKNYNKSQLRSMRSRHQKNSKKIPKIHLLIFNKKSSICQNDRQHREHWKLVTESYKILDNNPGCSLVLQVCALFKRLQIFFDFKHESTYYFDPVSSIFTSGITYNTGVIEIGAKEMLQEDTKYKVIGVLIHELCHLAINMVYMNNFDPYQMGESGHKLRFVSSVFEECRRNQNFDNIVGSVFKCYSPEHVNSELIVRPYQIMMHYIKNHQKIAECEQNYGQLFGYVSDVIEPEMERALPILKKLSDDELIIEFNSLIEPMKAVILHKEIKFQGVDTSIFEIIGNDAEVLGLLSNTDLKKILLKNDFKIGKFSENTTKFGYVERAFIGAGEKAFDSQDMIDILQTSKCLLLNGKAGVGKTTTFENLVSKFKIKLPNFWVSCVKLREFKNILNDNLNRVEDINSVCNLFCEILDLKSNFEVRIFKNLFFNNKVILLLDGIDEISPKFTNFILKVMKILKENSENIFWVSTRPHHVQNLQENLDCKIFNFQAYLGNDLRKFLFRIIKNYDIYDEETKLRYLEYLQDFFTRDFFKDLDNLMIIEIITILFLNKKIDIISKSFSRFELFGILIDEHMEKVKDAIDFEDRKFSLKFFHLFQILALKFVFVNDKIKDLKIMKKWQSEKKSWTEDKIQRFGIVIVNLDFLETDNENSIDFVHKSYAEFFVTQFLLEKIFDEDLSFAESLQIFELLKDLRNNNFDESFFYDYLDKQSNIEDQNLNEHIQKLIFKQAKMSLNFCNLNPRLKKINFNILNPPSTYLDSEPRFSNDNDPLFWCSFLRNNCEVMKRLWKVDNANNVFSKMINRNNIFHTLKLVEFCLGTNWHLILSKAPDNIESELQEFDITKMDRYEILSYRMAKFLTLVESCQHICSPDLLKSIILIYHNFSGKFQKIIFQKISSIYKNDKNFIIKILNIFINDDEIQNLLFFLTQFEYFSRDEILSHPGFTQQTDVSGSVLASFQTYDRSKHFEATSLPQYLFDKHFIDRFMIAVEQDGSQIFLLIHLCKTLQNRNLDVQEIFTYKKNLLKILNLLNDDEIIKFADSMRTFFQDSKEVILNCINFNFGPYDSITFNKVEVFFINFFEHNDDLLQLSMKKILFNEYSNKDEHLFVYLVESLDEFMAASSFYRKYNTKELLTAFIKWKIFPSVFFNMSLDVFPEFQSFLDDIFGSDRNLLIQCGLCEFSNIRASNLDAKLPLIHNLLNNFYQNNQNDVEAFMTKFMPNLISC